MKTKTRKRLLISSIAMLLVAVLALGTATFAWFSMNTSVSANGMKVTAQTNDTLQIKLDAQNQVYSTSATSSLNENLFPVAHVDFDDINGDGNGGDATNTVQDFLNSNGSPKSNTWYHQYSNSALAALGTNSDESSLSEKTYISDFTNYVAIEKFKVIRYGKSSGSTTKNLYISDIAIPTGVKVIISVADNQTNVDKYYEAAESQENLSPSDTTLLTNLAINDEHSIKAYIFFDGNHQDVYTQKIEDLKGSVSFTLSLTDAE